MVTPQDFNALVRNRRSVFPAQFVAGKAIDDAIIKEILVNATWAPNHAQTEPWQFTVFAGKGLQTFANFQADLYKTTSGDNFNEGKYIKLQQQPLLASHIIALGLRRNSAGRIPEIEEIEAVACAVQNIYLSVSVYGLGGYWTTGGITYREEAKSFFGLTQADKLLGFFYIGHVAIPSTRGKRIPLEEKLAWIDQ